MELLKANLDAMVLKSRSFDRVYVEEIERRVKTLNAEIEALGRREGVVL